VDTDTDTDRDIRHILDREVGEVDLDMDMSLDARFSGSQRANFSGQIVAGRLYVVTGATLNKNHNNRLKLPKVLTAVSAALVYNFLHCNLVPIDIRL